MAFNKNEILLDKVRSLVANDLETKEILLRLTSLEDPTLSCTAEGEEITNAIGAVITTLYRAKKASFSATNSLISVDLAAAQYGAKKEVAGVTEGVATITDRTFEILPVNGTTVKLAHKPVEGSIKFIYTYEKNEVATKYAVGAEATDLEAVVAEDGVVTLPTSVTSGKVYIEYDFENENAMRVVNKASDFPSVCSITIYAFFKDVCTEKTYSGKIICPKAKLNPESVELSLTSTGKHPFEFTCMQDYCEDDNELFTIIISE